MNILVTNDDGIDAPGLQSLAEAMQEMGQVTVVAPDHNWSACGHVKTMDKPLRVKPVPFVNGISAYACTGSPSDCVALVLLGLFSEKTDLVVSGINPHANLGHDVTCSGTVTAAFEACIFGVPAIAVSVDTQKDYHGDIDYSGAAWAARQVAEKTARLPGRETFVLNVNVPHLPPDQLKRFSITRMGKRIYHDELVRREDPRGIPYYWFGGDLPGGEKEDLTDYGELSKGNVSITPLQLDLTACHRLSDLRNLNWNVAG